MDDERTPAGGPLRGGQVEPAAVKWVMDYERSLGHAPTDRRHDRAFPGDIDSPPRIIEIKSTATSFRGSFLPLEPVQVEHARSDPHYCLYVVENVGQGDPRRFTLRILAGDHLRRLVSRATERRYFEVGWPTADYDATPIEAVELGAAPTKAAASPERSTVTTGAATTVAASIREALEALGGEASVHDVKEWVSSHYPGRWKDVAVPMADLSYRGSRWSQYAPERRFLERVSPGRYRLRS